jgi:crossover junction endodeoxyribonuclease RuvC
MVKSLLNMRDVPKYYDITDALAVAVCHLHRTVAHQRTYKNWKAYLSAHPEKLSSSGSKKR